MTKQTQQNREHKLKIAKKKDIKQTSVLLSSLQEQYDKLQKSTETQFQILLEAYNNTRDPSAPPYTATDLPTKLIILKEYRSMLVAEQSRLVAEESNIALNLARVALYANDKQRQAIVSQFQHLNIIAPSSSYSRSKLPMLKAELNKQHQITQENEKSLKDFNEQLTEYFVGKNATQKIETLNSEKQQVDEDLQKITEPIAKIQIQLDSATVQKITTQFNDAPDKTTFLDKLRADLDWQNSYLNPISLVNWATSKEFKAQIEAQTLALRLIELLTKQYNLNNKCLAINQQLEEQKTTLDSVKPSSSQILSKIPAKIADLLSLNPNQDAVISDIDLFDKLNGGLKALAIKIAEFENALELLNKLSDIDNISETIRLKFPTLNSVSSNPMNDAEILVLEKTQDEQALMKRNLRDSIQSCQDSILSCQECEQALNDLQQLSQNIVTKTELSQQVNKGQKKRRKLQLTETTEQAEQAEQADELVAQAQTASTHNITVSKRGARTPKKEPEQGITPEYSRLREQLNEWNDKIVKLSKELSPELKTWYETLFGVLQNKVAEETTLLQSIQLLRDIYFELSYNEKGAKSTVLWEYHVQYPNLNLNTSYIELLKLKPAFPIDKNPEELPSLTDKKMQELINNLYHHQRYREQQFPKEAALLKQAAINFHQMALACESQNGIAKSFTPAFYCDDIRYHCLEKHRGLGKAWEWLAELCTRLLNKMRSTLSSETSGSSERPERSERSERSERPERSERSDYRSRFFFVPTKSSQLLNEVATSLSAISRAVTK